jgi:C4-dicarboxylate transporter/malic acid transport protein
MDYLPEKATQAAWNLSKTTGYDGMTTHECTKMQPNRLVEMIRQFTPNWFAATMGTGVLALALAQLPLAIPWFRTAGEFLWFLDIALFVCFSLLYLARWIFFFDGARKIFGHSVVSMFFGCIPMGLATIINGLLVFGLPRWGDEALDLALDLWYMDALMALACGITIPFMMFTRQQHSIDNMTAVWLLPVVAAEVASVSGGLIVSHVADPGLQLLILVACYALWACSVPLAMNILAILLLRMAVHKLPPANMAASSWLSLGPIGTGALGLLVLGEATPAILSVNHLSVYAQGIDGFTLIGGIMLWGYGLWWLGMALLITLRYLRDGMPFNLGWWGYTFPLGVYALATLRLSTILPVKILSGMGLCLIAAQAVLWVLVSSLTFRGVWRGELFVSPCLNDPPG